MIFSLRPKDIYRHLGDMSATGRHVFGDMTFSLCPKNQPTCRLMSSQHNMSFRLAWSGRQNLMTCWANTPDIFKTCLHVGSRHVVWGVRQHDTMPTFRTKQFCVVVFMRLRPCRLCCNQICVSVCAMTCPHIIGDDLCLIGKQSTQSHPPLKSTSGTPTLSPKLDLMPVH